MDVHQEGRFLAVEFLGYKVNASVLLLDIGKFSSMEIEIVLFGLLFCALVLGPDPAGTEHLMP